MGNVAFLCSVFGRSKTPNPENDASKIEDTPDASSTGGGGAKDAATDQSPANPSRDSNDKETDEEEEEHLPLPPPPGGLNSRTVSFSHHRDKPHSIKSKLASSMSVKLPGHVNVGRQFSRLEEKATGIRDKTKLKKHDDSVWKKQIIPGGRNRAPDEDEGSTMYDEDGNSISTDQQNSPSTSPSFSKPDSDPEELSKN